MCGKAQADNSPVEAYGKLIRQEGWNREFLSRIAARERGREGKRETRREQQSKAAMEDKAEGTVAFEITSHCQLFRCICQLFSFFRFIATHC